MALSLNLIYHSLFPFDDEIVHKAKLPTKKFYSFIKFTAETLK